MRSSPAASRTWATWGLSRAVGYKLTLSAWFPETTLFATVSGITIPYSLEPQVQKTQFKLLDESSLAPMRLDAFRTKNSKILIEWNDSSIVARGPGGRSAGSRVQYNLAAPYCASGRGAKASVCIACCVQIEERHGVSLGEKRASQPNEARLRAGTSVIFRTRFCRHFTNDENRFPVPSSPLGPRITRRPRVRLLRNRWRDLLH